MKYQLCLLSAFFIGTLYADTKETGRRCPLLELANGVVNVTADGKEARFSCNKPFRIKGAAIAKCLHNGTWNHFPECSEVRRQNQPPTVFAATNPASSTQHRTRTTKPTPQMSRTTQIRKLATRERSTSTSSKVRKTTPVPTATTNLLSATLLSRYPSAATAKPSTKEMKTDTPAKQSAHSSTTIKTTTLLRDTIAPSATQPPLLETQQTEHSSLSSSSLLSETKSSPSEGTTVAGDKDIPTMPVSHDVTKVPPHSELSSKTDDNSIFTLTTLYFSQSSRSQPEGAIKDLATNEAQPGTPSSQTDTSVFSSTDTYLTLPSEPPDMDIEKATDGFIFGESAEIGIHPSPSEVDHPPPDQPSVSEPEPEPKGDNDQEQTNKQKEASDVGNGDKETFNEDLPSVPSIGIKPVRKGDKSTGNNLRLIIGVSFVVAAGMAVISYIVYRWEKRNRKRREEKKKNVGDAHGSPGPEDQTAVLMTSVDTNNTTERNLDPVDQKNGTTIKTEGGIDLGGQTSVLVSSPAVTDEEKLADLKSGTASNGNIAEIESKSVSNGTGTGLLGGTANGDILGSNPNPVDTSSGLLGTANGDILGSNPNPVDTSSGLLGTEIDTILCLNHDDKKVGMMTNDVTLTEIKIDSVV